MEFGSFFFKSFKNICWLNGCGVHFDSKFFDIEAVSIVKVGDVLLNRNEVNHLKILKKFLLALGFSIEKTLYRKWKEKCILKVTLNKIVLVTILEKIHKSIEIVAEKSKNEKVGEWVKNNSDEKVIYVKSLKRLEFQILASDYHVKLEVK